jgi:RecA-family ATPase
MSDELTFLQAASELTPRSVDWLVPGRLPLGYCTLLEGDPGLGKSLIALDLCARLSTGRPWPDGSPSPGPANAVFINREDGTDAVVLVRLKALGADLTRVFVPRREDLDFSLPSRIGRLEEDLVRLRARLVVLDPVGAFLDRSVVVASEQSVRRALDPLSDLARRLAFTALLQLHLNKAGGTHAAYRGLGSIAFVAACRSAWLVGEDPQDPRRRVLAQVKNNLAPPQVSLAYQVTQQEGGEPLLSWLGASPLTARDVLAGTRPAAPAQAGPRERAAAFLEAFLKAGPRTSREVWAAAREQALSPRTLRRAKEQLDVVCKPLWVRGVQHSYWLMPWQELPRPEPDPATPDFDAQLAAQEAQYPSACPLDEE